MHPDILSNEQREILPMISSFGQQFGLVGGTAIALHLGHRRSIDFDLFTYQPFDIDKIRSQIRKTAQIEHTFVQGTGELTVLANKVKLTFYHFPYQIEYSENFQNTIKLPSLITLGAMKSFALGKRAKWKDYVDLYFLLKKYSLRELISKTQELFGQEFNEKLFRTQLSYFKDIDLSEDIIYMPDHEVNQKEIETFLEETSLL